MQRKKPEENAIDLLSLLLFECGAVDHLWNSSQGVHKAAGEAAGAGDDEPGIVHGHAHGDGWLCGIGLAGGAHLGSGVAGG